MKQTPLTTNSLHHSLVAFALLLLVGLTTACEGDGQPPENTLEVQQSAIVNGTLEYGWPAVGALTFFPPGGSYFGSYCTGTLIAPRWVLTAAHCLENQLDGFYLSAPRVKFYLGSDANGLWGQPPSSGTFYQAQEFFVYPTYDSEEKTGDIGLVYLAEPVNNVNPLDLNSQAMDTSWYGDPVFFVGFGVTNGITRTGGGIKRSGWMNLLSYDQESFSTSYQDQGVCSGDSGGPGLMQLGGKWKVIGVNNSVSSFSGDPCTGLAFHARVDHYLAWLTSKMSSLDPNCNQEPDLCQCHAACLPSGQCDDSKCQVLDCGEIYECQVDCQGDETCREDCLAQGTPAAQARLDDLLSCMDLVCDDLPESQWSGCVLQECTEHLFNCMPPADCDLLGGDCPSGQACTPLAQGRTDCLPTLGREAGAACDPEGDTLACRDGLICLGEGDQASCTRICMGPGECPQPELCNGGFSLGGVSFGLCLCVDQDGDGFCKSEDCNDQEESTYPGAQELCGDSRDNNCNGKTDEGCTTSCPDMDGDGFCAAEDCNDLNRDINPDAAEVADGRDNDCDGLIDEDLGPEPQDLIQEPGDVLDGSEEVVEQSDGGTKSNSGCTMGVGSGSPNRIPTLPAGLLLAVFLLFALKRFSSARVLAGTRTKAD